jgi:NACalpha-BTF3-like transcription factor
MRGFQGIDRAVVEEVVARFGGDMELASQELLRIMAAQLERDEAALLKEKTKQLEAKQEEERKLRNQIVDHCVATFEVLTRNEVQDALRKHNYELPKAVAQLRQQSHARKLLNLQHIFSTASEEHLRKALESTDYDLGRAFALLRGSADVPQAPAVPEEEALHQSLIQLNGLDSRDKDAQDLLADMLRKNAGPDTSDQSKAAVIPASQNKEVNNAKDGLLPASLQVTLKAAGSGRGVYGSSVELVASVTGGEATPYDWIGLFELGAPASSPLTWAWYAGKPVSLAFPSYGQFEARYLRKVQGVITALAHSDPLFCGPNVKLRVEESGDVWAVHYDWDSQTEKLSSSAWIGLFAKDAPTQSYFAFQYLPTASGTLNFKRRLVNGTFEFRFFPYKFQGPLSVSAPLVVNLTDSVVCERVGDQLVVKTLLASVDPAVNTRVWVAVCFRNDERSNKYRRSAYITKPAQSFEFKAPIHAGLYECRIYDENCKVLARSNDFQI